MDAEDIILGLLIGIVLAVPIALLFSKPLPTQTIHVGATKPITVVYENMEEWEIIKDRETGRTTGVRVKRTAKET
jgi:hypothetical protein